MSNQSWPFDQPQNCAVITLQSIIFEGAPILQVTHDEEDQGWQFLGTEDAEVDQAAVAGLARMVELDPSILQLADLPPGWRAWRNSKSSPWQRDKKPTYNA